VVKVLDAASSDSHGNILVLITPTGMRRGEALALGWDAVDVESGVLKVKANMNAVADLLGHSSIAATGDTYGHASATATCSAMDGLSDALAL